MTSILTTAVLAGAAGLLAATPSLAESTMRTLEQDRVLYELQERCSKDAADFFAQIRREDDRAWLDTGAGTGPEGSDSARYETGALVRYDYENNYSRNFNGCFITVKYEARWHELGSTVHAEELWDVNSHRLLGRMRIQTLPPSSASPSTTKAEPAWLPICRFADKDCDVEKWQALIKPYMQDSK